MIEMDTCYTMSQIPSITYGALEDYAERLVQDFAPEFLKTPGIIDVDAFLEYYLHLTVDFHRISYDRQILGMTAFNDGTVDVLCEETGQIEQIFVKKGTVIIDTSLSTKRNVPRLRFTMTHEGMHWLIHREAFDIKNPFGPAGIYENQFLAAKEGRVDYSRSMKERTDIDRMERQADFLSSAFLMPRPAMQEAYREYFKFYDDKPHRIVRGTSPMDDCYAVQLPEYVASLFGVSKRAALIRLEKLTAIVNKGWPYYS